MSNDGKRMSCNRSDTGVVRNIQIYNSDTNSEPTNTTEQIDFSDATSTQFSDTAESGKTWEYEDTTESGNTSLFADTTQGSNASKTEDANRTFRSKSINNATDLPGPEKTQLTEGKVLIECNNPATTCVTVSCTLHGPIGSTSSPFISFSMSATIEDLGEFTSPCGFGKLRLL